MGSRPQNFDGNILDYENRVNKLHFDVCYMYGWGGCMGDLAGPRTNVCETYIEVCEKLGLLQDDKME